jgi:hypothetical protein
MASTRKRVFDFADLHTLVIECGTCHTQITYDLRQKDTFALAHGCPGCREPFGELLTSGIGDYMSVFDRLAKAAEGRNVRIEPHRIKIEVDDQG